MRVRLGLGRFGSVLLAAACLHCSSGDRATPTEPAPVPAPVPTPGPVHIDGLSPSTLPLKGEGELTIYGLGFQFPVQVFLSQPACMEKTELAVRAIGADRIDAHVSLAGNACLTAGRATVLVTNPATSQSGACESCVTLTAP